MAALITGDIDDTDARVILSSLGFAISSAVAASGASQRLRASGALRHLGTATAAMAGTAFVLLLAGLRTGEWGSEGIWRGFGCAALLALAGSHACLVLGARRRSDSKPVDKLVAVSLLLAGIDTVGGLLPIAGLVDGVGEAGARLLAVTLVLLVLTTVLPPLVRRLDTRKPARSDAIGALTEEVETIADRIEDLARGPSPRTPEIRREAERLRDLARSFQP